MITWILAIVSLVGNYLNCRKKRICFIIWIACNVGWFIFDLLNEVYSRAILDMIQTILCLYGFFEWSKERSKDGKTENRN